MSGMTFFSCTGAFASLAVVVVVGCGGRVGVDDVGSSSGSPERSASPPAAASPLPADYAGDVACADNEPAQAGRCAFGASACRITNNPALCCACLPGGTKDDSAWQCQLARRDPGCPAARPERDSACSTLGIECAYCPGGWDPLRCTAEGWKDAHTGGGR